MDEKLNPCNTTLGLTLRRKSTLLICGEYHRRVSKTLAFSAEVKKVENLIL